MLVESVSIGNAVHVVWDDVHDDVTIPRFTLTATNPVQEEEMS